MKKAPKLSLAVASMIWPVMRSTTCSTSLSWEARARSSPVLWTVLVSVGVSRYSGCCRVTCPPPRRAAVSMKSAKERSCKAVNSTAKKPPNTMDDSVSKVQRFWRHRLRHATNASLGPLIAGLLLLMPHGLDGTDPRCLARRVEHREKDDEDQHHQGATEGAGVVNAVPDRTHGQAHGGHSAELAHIDANVANVPHPRYGKGHTGNDSNAGLDGALDE